MTERFVALGRYAAADRPDAILFTCSAFGPCIEAVQRDLAPLPVHKPNTAVIEAAVALGGRLALVASFPPTLESLPREFPPGVDLLPVPVPAALAALEAGDGETHDALVAEAARRVPADAYVLTQFSLARAAEAVRTATGRPVLTTPDTAVAGLRRALEDGAPQ